MQANLISFYEEKRFCKYFQRSYYKHIQSNCNPLVNKLMLIEDDDWSERAIPIIVGLIAKFTIMYYSTDSIAEEIKILNLC